MTTTEELEYLRKQVANLRSENAELAEKNKQLNNQVTLLENNSSDLLSLVEQSLFAIAVMQNGRFVYLNKAFGLITGYDLAWTMSLSDYSYFELIHPDDREELRKLTFDREHETDAKNYNITFRVLHKNGGYRYLESWSRRIKYNGDYASLSTLLDVTDKVLALAELQTSQEKYKTIFEHSPIGIYYSDVHGGMGEVNETTVKILGSPSKEATQKINLFTFPLLVEAGFSAHLRECIETGRSIIADTDYVTKWGKRVWLRYYLNPIYKHGTIDGALINFVDITEAKSAELALRQNEVELLAAKEKAEESNRLKTAFLENMNHEIRTPLNGILGFLELYDEEDITPADREEYREIITNCAGQLLSVITDILEASVLSTGKLIVHNKIFSPHTLIRHLAFNFEHERKKRESKSKQNIAFQTVCDLPSRFDAVNADQDKVQQVMINLINNALKFTHSGTIELGCIPQSDDSLLFYVKDTGIGIAPEKHELIFERFRQADESLSRNYGGTGLGLTISKSLVELMGGTIGVESEPGVGSYFWFTVPVICETVSQKQTASSTIKTAVEAKVLLVDDVAVVGEYCKRLTQNTKIDLLYVASGQDAITECQRQEFDAILLDLQMPLLDGYETFCRIREINDTVPIVAVTANARTHTQERVLSMGFANYLSKPFKKHEFLDIIANCISDK